MRIEAKTEADRWVKPSRPGDPAEPGYEEWLAAELEAAAAELDAGQGIPAVQVWKDLGLE
ncbi:hypothetical protein [Methylobacterium sp.]|uniref:hypothetical protein n=1 Tax=Methylobacterium sp. TaxID=409 RepID=UPI003C74F96B